MQMIQALELKVIKYCTVGSRVSALGKRAGAEYNFGLGKKRDPYAFGLGKRANDYAFGMGKKDDPYAFGLGKRADR